MDPQLRLASKYLELRSKLLKNIHQRPPNIERMMAVPMVTKIQTMLAISMKIRLLTEATTIMLPQPMNVLANAHPQANEFRWRNTARWITST